MSAPWRHRKLQRRRMRSHLRRTSTRVQHSRLHVWRRQRHESVPSRHQKLHHGSARHSSARKSFITARESLSCRLPAFTSAIHHHRRLKRSRLHVGRLRWRQSVPLRPTHGANKKAATQLRKTLRSHLRSYQHSRPPARLRRRGLARTGEPDDNVHELQRQPRRARGVRERGLPRDQALRPTRFRTILYTILLL